MTSEFDDLRDSMRTIEMMKGITTDIVNDLYAFLFAYFLSDGMSKTGELQFGEPIDRFLDHEDRDCRRRVRSRKPKGKPQ